MNQLCQVTIPGKIMIAGEYSVLAGGRALACTVNRYMRVTLHESEAAGISIQSDLWKDDIVRLREDQNLTQLPTYMQPAFQATRRALELIPSADKNCFLAIQCEYPSTFGMGSSSALYLGILTAFFKAYGHSESPLEAARKLQQEQQFYASGYDIWTQHTGGMVLYDQGQAENVGSVLDSYFSIFVGGAGAPTAQLVKSTVEWLDTNLQTSELLAINEKLISLALALLRRYDEDLEQEFFQAIRTQQFILLQSPAANKYLHELLQVEGAYVDWAAKTTGAGGEDAILIFGKPEARRPAEIALKNFGWRALPIQMTSTGVSTI